MIFKNLGINTRNLVNSALDRLYWRALVNAEFEPPDSISHGVISLDVLLLYRGKPLKGIGRFIMRVSLSD